MSEICLQNPMLERLSLELYFAQTILVVRVVIYENNLIKGKHEIGYPCILCRTTITKQHIIVHTYIHKCMYKYHKSLRKN